VLLIGLMEDWKGNKKLAAAEIFTYSEFRHFCCRMYSLATINQSINHKNLYSASYKLMNGSA